MKRGQIEMIGLVVVVLLLVIGGLFYLRFALLPSPSDAHADDALLLTQSSNLLIALSNLYLSCEEDRAQVSTLFAYCVQEKQYCGVSACSYLAQKVPSIINASGIRYPYRLWAVHDDASFLTIGDCALGDTFSKTIESGSFIIRADSTKFTLHLRFCRE